jgi:protein-S-isoprenylcysteine O-methyltransferase Ste14
MDAFFERVAAWLMLTLSAGLGGVSLVAFAVFLFAGAPGVIVLDVGLWGGGVTNTCLSLLFFVQHSGMVRQSFKRWLARFVPEHSLGAIYSIVSSVILLSVVLAWQESQQVIATATGMLWWTARVLFFLALGGLIWGMLSLKGFDAFGLRPIQCRLRTGTSSSSVFEVRGPYRWVRHPLYACVLLMIWSYPHLTVDRLLFNLLWTVWIVIGTLLEERDLVAEFGGRYRGYQHNVSLLIPHRIAGWIDPADDLNASRRHTERQ